MAKQHTVISFPASAADERYFRMEANVYYGSPTSPLLGRPYYIQVISSEPYTLRTSADIGLTKVGTGLPAYHSEQVTFTMTAEASLAYPPDGLVALDWLGRIPSATRARTDGRRLVMPEPVMGVLTASYRYLYERWRMITWMANVVVLMAFDRDNQALGNMTLQWTQAPDDDEVEGDETLEAVSLQWRDAMTLAPIPGGELYINRTWGPVGQTVPGMVSIGKTNGAGVITFSAPKGRHQIKFVHPQYINTDEDSIADNDYLVIE